MRSVLRGQRFTLTGAKLRESRRSVRKLVVLPIHPELLFALEAEFVRRNPEPNERVLLNPRTGGPLRRPRLHARSLALGRRAGVGHMEGS